MSITASSPDAEQRILGAAVQLFARKGLAATSVREIVEAAGVTKPTLYYHFGNKEGVCRAVFQSVIELVTSKVGAALALDTNPQARLVEVVWAMIEIKRDHPDLVQLTTSLLFGPADEVPGLVVRDLVENLGAVFIKAAEQACASGLVQPGAEMRMARMLRGVISAWVLTTPYADYPAIDHALAEQMVADLIWGLARRGTTSLENLQDE